MERVEVKDIEYVLAVAEELSFTRAAARLGIAQPPLSRAIGRLERRLGTELFHRTSRVVTLTSAGALFVEEGSAILEAIDRTVARVRHATHSRALVIATRPTIGTGFLRAIIEQCRQLPSPLAVEVLSSRSPVQAVRDHRADAALACGSSQDLSGMRVEQLVEQPTVALMSTSHPLAAQPAVTLAAVQSATGFLVECPDLPLDEIVHSISLHNSSMLVSADTPVPDGQNVCTVPVLDSLSSALCLVWSPTTGNHPRLTALIRQARRAAYSLS
ncbi:LysR family transcriptional regulator [Nocardia salmonicida]|uniref:LysR family transcriptional regulator n=1 Tax=Nocardia salmonicida TaxID=53431 RepID=UPI003CEB0007